MLIRNFDQKRKIKQNFTKISKNFHVHIVYDVIVTSHGECLNFFFLPTERGQSHLCSHTKIIMIGYLTMKIQGGGNPSVDVLQKMSQVDRG